jgi:hypothetical protein
MKESEPKHFNDRFIEECLQAIAVAETEGRSHHAECYRRSLDKAITEREAAKPKMKVVEFPKKQEQLF